MLYEDDVVDAVVTYLGGHDWEPASVAYAHQHGDDIVAVKRGRRLVVEAKGEGSSKRSTRRYGLPFLGKQVESHVAVAVVRTMAVLSASPGALAAMALPDNAHHRARVQLIEPALDRLGIGVFWVDPQSRSVRLQASWSL